MPSLSAWLKTANPPGSRDESRATQSTRSDPYVPAVQLLLGFFRMFWPIPRLCLLGWAAVTLHDDVEEVLSRPDVFTVPFGKEMARLNDGTVPGTEFLLGIDNSKAHDDQLKLVMSAFKRADVEKLVALPASRNAKKIVHDSTGRLEAIGGLVTQIPLDICVEYYGVAISKPREFAYAVMDVSGHLFGLPPIVPDATIDVAAAYVRKVIDSAIDDEINNPSGRSTVLVCLVTMYKAGQLTREQVRAFLIGMIVGFVPTNTMAGGHILDMLLRRLDFLAAARSAALAGDDDLLSHCLFEALRFMPINPGPFRICSADFIIAAGTSRATRIRKGTKMLASTMSAMFDCKAVEKPFHFVPGRPASNLMNFGFGMHWCVGAFIAQAQITQTFKALVVKDDLRRAAGSQGELKRRNGFPDSLVVEFTP
jgi:cytochrome P450